MKFHSILILLLLIQYCASVGASLIPYEPAKHCKEPIYLPKYIHDSKAVSAKGVREIESNNRDCIEYIQRVAINNTEYALKNKPNSFKEDFTIFSYGILFSICIAIFIFI